jgi:hypothetical protein
MKINSQDAQWVSSRLGNLIVEVIVNQPSGMRVSRHGIATTKPQEVARWREGIGAGDYYMFSIIETQAREQYSGCSAAFKVIAGEVLSR